MLLVTLLALASPQTAEAPPVGLTVTVRKLPAAFQASPVAHVIFNNKGAVSGCTIVKSSGSVGIDKVACAQAVASYTMPSDRDGAPAPTDITIAFETEAPKN